MGTRRESGAKRRGAESEVSRAEGGQRWPYCAPPLQPQAWLLSLLPLPVLPSEHHLEAFSSATRDGGDGGHQPERQAFRYQKALWGGVGGENGNQDLWLGVT